MIRTSDAVRIASLLVALAGCAKGTPNQSAPSRTLVQDGSEQMDAVWRWRNVAIRDWQGTLPVTCSGVLVAPKWVLTAEHCLHKEDGTPQGQLWVKQHLRVLAGESPQDEYEIDSYKLFGNGWQRAHKLITKDGRDLALVKLKWAVEVPADHAYVLDYENSLARSEDYAEWLKSRASRTLFPTDQGLAVYGYGKSDVYNTSLGRLRTTYVNFRGFFGLKNEELHAGWLRNTTCVGDSGGGLYANKDAGDPLGWKLIGITSRNFTYDGGECRDSDGTIYTRIDQADVRQWIVSTITSPF